MDLFKQMFFYQTSKRGQILKKNCFSPQSGPHTAKLYFSVVFKHFGVNSKRTSLFIQKKAISESCMEILRKFVFLNKFERGESCGKLGFV